MIPSGLRPKQDSELTSHRAQAAGSVVTKSTKSSRTSGTTSSTTRTHSGTDQGISEDMGVQYGGPINTDEELEGEEEKTSMLGRSASITGQVSD